MLRHSLALVTLPCLLVAAQAGAKAKLVQEIKTEVDGKPFKVVKYDDGTVMVVQRTFGGKKPTPQFHDRMRRAVIQATGCALTDELLDPAYSHFTGRLTCPATSAGAAESNASARTP